MRRLTAIVVGSTDKYIESRNGRSRFEFRISIKNYRRNIKGSGLSVRGIRSN